ncbi:MAG: hypothetical protein R3222_01415 [Balneolaceae bacterium]|nr:hypothetical protein [Balneolaceae bacterium]
MKRLLLIFSIAAGLTIAGCSSDDSGHSHGEDGDHTHEAPAQQSTADSSDAVRIGGGDDSADHDSTHTHDEEGNHSHEEGGDHTHEEDTHSHGDEEHSH